MRASLILSANNTDLELLRKEILNLHIKDRRPIALRKCQCSRDVLKSRSATTPMSEVAEGLVNGWEVSLKLGAAAWQESNVSSVGTALEQSGRGERCSALLGATPYQGWKQSGELLSHHCKLYLLNEKVLRTSTSLKTFREIGLKRSLEKLLQPMYLERRQWEGSRERRT